MPTIDSVLDLCRPPYNAAPGTDITSALQAAINDIAAAYPLGGEIYFSVPGTYSINGPLQSGAVNGETYSGQILFPAVPSNHSLTIRIRGTSAPRPPDGGANRPATGVTLVSNATSGYVFDAPGTYLMFGLPFTNVMPVFEDIIIQTPFNPQCGGINAYRCMSFQADHVIVQGGATGFTSSSLTGMLEGIVCPRSSNAGGIKLHCAIRGFPTGLALTEHALLDYVRVSWCRIGFSGRGSGHACAFNYVSCEGTPTLFQVRNDLFQGAALTVYGTVDWECTGAPPVAFVDENADLMRGKITIHMATPVGGLPLALGASQRATNLDVELLTDPSGSVFIGGGGWRSLHPIDTFRRTSTPLTSNTPGQCFPTMHPWSVVAGSFQVANQQLSSTNGTSQSACAVPVRNLGEPRSVSLTTTLATSGWHVNLLVNRVVGGPANGNQISVILYGTMLALQVNGTTRRTATGVVAAGQMYTVTCKTLTNAAGQPEFVRVYLNGTLQFAYGLTAAEQAALAPGTVPPRVEDGIALYEPSSVVSAFKVTAATADPAFVASGTATLASGSATISDQNITASSTIRLTNMAAGGGVGALSVALTPGTGFTVNSSSASDTSRVYYEVVSY